MNFFQNAERLEVLPPSLLAIAESVTEGMPSLNRLSWEQRFLQALRPGARLDRVWIQWVLWSLRDPKAGLLHLNVDTLAHPTLEMLERFYMRKLTGVITSEADIARMEGVVQLMEEDAANWRSAQHSDFWEDGIAVATRAFWDARNGGAEELGCAVRAAARCRQPSDFAGSRSEALLDLASHAPLGPVF
jgi:hypothetical protein